MGIANITSSRAKLVRAYEHLQALKDEIATFGQRKDAKTGQVTYGRDGPWHVVYLGPTPALPLHTALIAGDLLNNMRAALDHLVWQLVLREDHKPDNRHSFPICKTPQQFLDKVKPPPNRKDRNPLLGLRIKGDAWTLIQDAQPFKRPEMEQDVLPRLARLSNVDKHRAVLVQPAFVNVRKFITNVRWRDIQPVDRRLEAFPLSPKQPTEIARFLFPLGTEIDLRSAMYVEGDIPLRPVVSDGETYMTMQMLEAAARHIYQVLDNAAALERIKEIAPQSGIIFE